MNKAFLKILSEYIPTSINGGRFEGELKKLNLSRQEYAELLGVSITTLARKFNKNSPHYKKKSKNITEEWALYGIKSAIRSIEKRAEEVKQKKLKEAKELVNYTKGRLSNKDIILAEKRSDILEAIKINGSNIKDIAKEVNLGTTTVVRHILNDDDLQEEFKLQGEVTVSKQMQNLIDITEDAGANNKDKISAIKEILKNTKSDLLDKVKAPQHPANPLKGGNVFINNLFNKNNKPKESLGKGTIINEEGEEFVILDEVNDKFKK